MAIPPGDKDGLFTYKDYLSWPDDERWELINGVAYNMSPAPARRIWSWRFSPRIFPDLSIDLGRVFDRDR